MYLGLKDDAGVRVKGKASMHMACPLGEHGIPSWCIYHRNVT